MFFTFLLVTSGLAGAQHATTRVSVDSAGNQGNDESQLWNGHAISADGRYIVFDSYATNLVPGDTNGVPDIFVNDRLTGETTRVSVSSSGSEQDRSLGDAAISADGRYVAFDSLATNLVPGDTNGLADVFVHDRLTGETTRVSVNSAGTEGNDDSVGPAISADGRYVAFDSYATNLVPGDTNGAEDVFVHDLWTGVTTRVSVDSAGNEANDESGSWYAPWLSPEGRYVAFESRATNLVPGDRNHTVDIFLHDRVTGQTTLESVSSSGEEGDWPSEFPSLSADVRYVAFMSRSTNLVPGDTNQAQDVFLHDRLTAQTTRVSVSSSGGQGNYDSWNPSISADGRYVAFHSYATNLVPGDSNMATDVFLHDRQTGETTRVSLDPDGAPGNNSSFQPSISADGRCVAFESAATNLVLGDTNATADVFVRGPELTLEADPAEATPGQTLTLTEYGGVPGNRSSLWAVAVNNTPTFSLVAIGSFGGDGNFVVSGVVPPSLSGNTITFRGYAIGHTGFVAATNDAPVAFR
ncbi:MAG: calcium-binding protein [Planctomycetota bacterium]